MTDRDLLKQALEALEWWETGFGEEQEPFPIIAALRERLAQPEQEPVAWVTGWHDGHCVIRAANPAAILPIGVALYTTPPRREWQGLTDDERSYYLQTASNVGWWKAAQIIEVKLREKNT